MLWLESKKVEWEEVSDVVKYLMIDCAREVCYFIRVGRKNPDND